MSGFDETQGPHSHDVAETIRQSEVGPERLHVTAPGQAVRKTSRNRSRATVSLPPR